MKTRFPVGAKSPLPPPRLCGSWFADGIARHLPPPQPSSAAGLAFPASCPQAPALGMEVSSSAGELAHLWPQSGTRVVLMGLLVFPDQFT